jgi:hypothetical protein
MALPTNRPIRFLQVNTFYPAYLRDFYGVRPNLVDADYNAHIDALLDDGFSGVHMLTRSLSKLGWDTFQVLANAAPAQRAWLKKNDFHLAEPLDIKLVTAMQIELFKPDVLYFTDVVLFDSNFLRKLPTRPPLTIGWRGFPIPAGTDLSAYDVIATSFDRLFDEAPTFGAKDVQRHSPGFPLDLRFDDSETFDRDVIFSGTITAKHVSRLTMLQRLWQASRGEDGGPSFSFDIFMPDASALPPAMQAVNKGSVWGNTMLRTLRRSRVVINPAVDGYDQPPNMRVIEATGAGAFLLTNHHPDLGKFFTPGEELETFKDVDELIAKTRYALAHEEQRRAIARAGRARCLKDHNLTQATRGFHDMIVHKLSGQ